MFSEFDGKKKKPKSGSMPPPIGSIGVTPPVTPSALPKWMPYAVAAVGAGVIALILFAGKRKKEK